MNNRLINTKVAAAGCTDIVDNYNPFGGGVALYQLNGNATDVSGNYNGTASNVTYGTGVFGQAGVFNGSSSRITTSLTQTNTSAWSWSFWVNINAKPSAGYIAAILSNMNGSAPFAGVTFLIDSPYFGIASNGSNIWTTNTINPSLSTWYHIAITYNGSGKITPYINGQSYGAISHTPSNGNTITIGDSDVGSWGSFNGLIDQVRIFNTALDPLEVEALYTEEYCICDGTVDTLNILGDGSCIALYPLDGNANDLSGNYGGTPTNVSYGAGEFDLAGVFNGSSSRIALPQNSLNSFTEYSISTWINTSSSADQTIINNWGYQNGSAEQGWLIQKPTSNKIRVLNYNGGATQIYDSTGVISLSTWINVIVTNTQSQIKIYFNGVLDSTHSSSGFTFNASYPMRPHIGAYQYSAGTYGFFNGSIDQVRIFNKALNQAEVTTLYNETACSVPNPLENVDFHYDPTTLSDGNVTAWTDGGNINRDLELVSGTTTISKVTSGGIEYVDFPFSSSDTTPSVLRVGGSPLTTFSDYPTNTSVTFVQFVNISTSYQGTIRYPEPMGIYNTNGSENGVLQYILWRYGLSVQYRAFVIANNGSRFYNVGLASEATYIYPYGTWRMIGFTFEYNPSATSYLKIYIDGALKETWTNTGTWGVANNTLILGHKDAAFYEARGGYKIGDTLGFFGEAKTQSEMAAIYNSLKGKYGL